MIGQSLFKFGIEIHEICTTNYIINFCPSGFHSVNLIFIGCLIMDCTPEIIKIRKAFYRACWLKLFLFFIFF